MIFWTPQILPDDNITSSCPTMACLHFVPFLEREARESEATYGTVSATKSSSKTGVFTTCRASGSGGLAANWLLQESHASSSTTTLLLCAILGLLLCAILPKRVKMLAWNSTRQNTWGAGAGGVLEGLH